MNSTSFMACYHLRQSRTECFDFTKTNIFDDTDNNHVVRINFLNSLILKLVLFILIAGRVHEMDNLI